MESQSQQQVNYNSYEQLIEPPKNVKIEQLIQDIENKFKSNQNWSEQFGAIDNLRSLNKFKNAEFIQKILPIFIDRIVEQVDQIRSNLSKNALILIKEVFMLNTSANIKLEHLQKLLPKIYLKAINDKSFIKSEALEAIKQIEKPSDELNFNLATCFCEIGNDKNTQIQELVCLSILNKLKNNEQKVQSLSKEIIQLILVYSINQLQAKRQVLIKTGKEIYLMLEKKIGNQVQQLLTDDQKKIIKAEMEASKKAQDKGGFQEFLKKQKK